MSDPVMKDIKNGKGLKPLPSSNQAQSTSQQSGVATDQQDASGIIYEKFSLTDKKKDRTDQVTDR